MLAFLLIISTLSFFLFVGVNCSVFSLIKGRNVSASFRLVFCLRSLLPQKQLNLKCPIEILPTVAFPFCVRLMWEMIKSLRYFSKPFSMFSYLLHFQIYEITSSSGGCIQKPFSDYENMYERIKHRVPANIDKPPRRKFLVAEARLHEKRRAWIELLVNHLLNNELEK